VANHKSALKRHRQSIKAYARNKAVRTRVKNVVKSVRKAVAEGDATKASEALTAAIAVLDRAAQKKVLHWRNAGRRVSRLTKAVNKLKTASA
jgi:small subunit ribosomal protein S20